MKFGASLILLFGAASLSVGDGGATNAPAAAVQSAGAEKPSASSGSSDGLLAARPADSPAEAAALKRIRETIARRPDSGQADAMKTWLVEVIIRCEQFLTEAPASPRIREVRAVNSQHRMEVFAATGDQNERTRALKLAKQAISDNLDAATLQGRLVLLRAVWAEDPKEGIAQATRISRDFPNEPPTAEALWTLMRLQQRKGDEKSARATALELLTGFPKSSQAIECRAMLKQFNLVGHTLPSNTLTDATGKRLELGSLRGNAVVLDFWRADTIGQTEGTQELQRLADLYKEKGLVVIGINLDTDRKTFDQAIATHPRPWPQVFANDPANTGILAACAVETNPTRMLADPFGLISRLGLDSSELEPLLRQWQSRSMLASATKQTQPSQTQQVAAAKPAAEAPAAKSAPKAAGPAAKQQPKSFGSKLASSFAGVLKEAQTPAWSWNEKKKASSSKATEKKKASVTSSTPSSAASPEVSVATAATHQTINGVVYAKPLEPSAQASTVSTTQVARSSSTTRPSGDSVVAKPLPTTQASASQTLPPAPTRIEAVSSGSAPKVTSAAPKPDKAAMVSETKPAKADRAVKSASKTSTSSTTGKSKSRLRTDDDADSLADRPDMSLADRKAASAANAEKILKAEEELASWSEMEELFGSKKPASIEGSLAWYQDMADRCRLFVKEFPTSPHGNVVRINEGRCRLQLYQATKDTSQRSRALAAAHEALAGKPNENDALRAHFILLNANWPDNSEAGTAEAKAIEKKFPHRKETAAAMMMHMQFRRRQGHFKDATSVAEELIKKYPDSPYVPNARALAVQLRILQNPCPTFKFTGLRGEAVDTSALRGRPFLVEFWSASARNAETDSAKIVEIYERYRSKGFTVLTICVDRSRDGLDIFQGRNPLPWPVYWDGQGMKGLIPQQFGVDTTPMRFLVEPTAQRITSTHLSPEGLAVALDLWIDKNQPPPPPGQEQPPASGILKKMFGL